MQTVCLHAPSPSCRVAPTCAHPRYICGGILSLPFCARVSRRPTCVQMGNVGSPKGTHSPHFSPHAPTLSLTGQRAQDPPPLPLPAPFYVQTGASSTCQRGMDNPRMA